jgi:hypothetical protein
MGAVLPIVVATVPVEVRVAHHPVQHQAGFIDDNQPVRIPIARISDIDAVRIDRILVAPIIVVFQSRASAKEHQDPEER